jgi:hypothetical protein
MDLFPAILGLLMIGIGVLIVALPIVPWLVRVCRDPLINFYSLFYDKDTLEAKYGSGESFLKWGLAAALILSGIVFLLPSL